MACFATRFRFYSSTRNQTAWLSLALLAACSNNDGPGNGGASGGFGGGNVGGGVSSGGGSAGATGTGGSGASSSGAPSSSGASGLGAAGGSSGLAGGGGSGGLASSAGAAGGASLSGSAGVGAAGNVSGMGGAVNVGGTGGGAGGGGAGGAPVACQAPAAVTGTALTVDVDLSKSRATVGADLMGIYSAVYDNDFRKETTSPLLKAAGVRSIRYPGGSYSDVYHWSTHTATTHAKGTASEGVPYLAPNSDFGNFIGLLESVGAFGMITVNYGSNPAGTGPGVPQEAAAWVAYANGAPSNTSAIGVDSTGTDWKTVGYWAGLRAADKLPVDDGQNFLRISHPTPVGIKYWEVGNELYGNGYYYGGEGWEEDLNVPHDGTARAGHASLSPVKYGQVFPSFARAMKAVDPTVQVGAILHWPYTEYASPNATDWNDSVLNADTCATLDFGINHWYAGDSLTDLLARPRTDIPKMFSDLQSKVKTRCPSKAGTLPIAVTEWGPNFLNFEITPPAQTQIIGVFAADAYANFMEQGALSVHWLELHNANYLGATDTPAWGYHAQQMAAYLANAGDELVTATVQTPPAAFAGGLFQAHASKHADGGTAILLVNTSPTAVAAATVNVSGFAGGAKLPCVGTLHTYAPSGVDADGPVTSAPVFSTNDTNNRVTVAVPAYSVVAVTFPRG